MSESKQTFQNEQHPTSSTTNCTVVNRCDNILENSMKTAIPDHQIAESKIRKHENEPLLFDENKSIKVKKDSNGDPCCKSVYLIGNVSLVLWSTLTAIAFHFLTQKNYKWNFVIPYLLKGYFFYYKTAVFALALFHFSLALLALILIIAERKHPKMKTCHKIVKLLQLVSFVAQIASNVYYVEQLKLSVYKNYIEDAELIFGNYISVSWPYKTVFGELDLNNGMTELDIEEHDIAEYYQNEYLCCGYYGDGDFENSISFSAHEDVFGLGYQETRDILDAGKCTTLMTLHRNKQIAGVEDNRIIGCREIIHDDFKAIDENIIIVLGLTTMFSAVVSVVNIVVFLT